MSQKPISELRRRMLEDMAVRKFSETTCRNYIRHIAEFAKFLSIDGRFVGNTAHHDPSYVQSRWYLPRNLDRVLRGARCRRQATSSEGGQGRA
jgi:hypothetical protein